MEYTGDKIRMSRAYLPSTPMRCNLDKPCAYRVSNTCADPKLYKANGDSACHKMGVRAIYSELQNV